MTGIIADIQRASVHDGPGLRTTVFFKGCPLRCSWCHNPECISPKPQTLFYPDKCIHCGGCAQGCFSGARVLCGKIMDTDTVLGEILADKDYYGTEGGVTFSGGEPLLQADFLAELTDACIASGIRCAMETSLWFFREDIFTRMQLIMADLKIWDDETHRRYTGVSNERIRENFRRLNELGIPIIARTPVIPEISQGIPEISEFLRGLENVKKYELLPYHPLGNAKLTALGMGSPSFTVPDKELMKELNQHVFIR